MFCVQVIEEVPLWIKFLARDCVIVVSIVWPSIATILMRHPQPRLSVMLALPLLVIGICNLVLLYDAHGELSIEGLADRLWFPIVMFAIMVSYSMMVPSLSLPGDNEDPRETPPSELDVSSAAPGKVVLAIHIIAASGLSIAVFGMIYTSGMAWYSCGNKAVAFMAPSGMAIFCISYLVYRIMRRIRQRRAGKR
jgi:hypothetical protein